ncbi:MAG: alpha/beta hydrolase [Gammaproteobacteria bacterium]|jgi:alpha-beta hydrolase superfamily lysophospholipase|nr:alpha/beta hydrolase [Gammaproteobacteria bacterium]
MLSPVSETRFALRIALFTLFASIPWGIPLAFGSTTEIAFSAADGARVFATHARAKTPTKKIVLLFHQAGSNRHEYDPITPELNEAGFDTLAVDQRSGGRKWGHPNKTVDAMGHSASYAQAYPDLQGALTWAIDQRYTAIIAVGSSYSASLNFLLASENPHRLTAGASFSPGEYFPDKDRVKRAASKVKIPYYVTAGAHASEEQRVGEVLSLVNSANVKRYRANSGVHGASTLRADVNPNGYRKNLEHFKEFLTTVAPR